MEAEGLAQEIERTVARGVVLAGQKTDMYQKSSMYRPMDDKEALAVGLEFFVTVLDVPLMQSAIRRVVDSDSIEWRPERPGAEREETGPFPIQGIDQEALRDLLLKIVDIAHELQINLPEIT
jgi:hypothetical protein